MIKILLLFLIFAGIYASDKLSLFEESVKQNLSNNLEKIEQIQDINSDENVN